MCRSWVGVLLMDLQFCMTTRLALQMATKKGLDHELPPVFHAEDLQPSAHELHTVVATGQTIEKYIENFLEELQKILEKEEWDFVEEAYFNEEGAYLSDTEIVNRHGLDLRTKENNFPYSSRRATNSSKYDPPNFLEIGSLLSSWIETESSKFVPRAWRPMLASRGHEVGAGQFGRVFVIDTKMDSTGNADINLAIKLEKKPGNIKDSEINLGMNMNHPYLLKVWDSDFVHHAVPANGKPRAGLANAVQKHKAVLMESASGGDLKVGYKLPREQLAKAMLEMFVVMDYIHYKGYVHSDFKPEQILLSAEGAAKLGDLGLTCKNGAGGVSGSPIYIAPEVVRTETRAYSADMWAVGVSLYRLTHENLDPPFLRSCFSVEDVFYKLKKLQNHHILHSGTSTLDELIMGLLTVNVHKRLTSIEALNKAKRWAKEEGLTDREINDIIYAKRDGSFKRAPLPKSWKHCIKKDCLSLNRRCKEFSTDPVRVYCEYPCHESRSGRGKSCATCKRPDLRSSVDHCETCNPGYHIVGSKCAQYTCEADSFFDHCATCQPEELRMADNHCASCSRGHYLSGTTCLKMHAGHEVVYLGKGGKWKPGVIDSSSDGKFMIKGKGNVFAKEYTEFKLASQA